MAEVGVSVAAKLAEYLVHPTLQQLQYLFCVSKITKNVEIKKEELILKQGSVQERVQEAINKTERIDGEVDKWRNDVEGLIAEVKSLEQELRANNGCLRGWRPTWRRYRLCKKLAKTTQRMIDLRDKSNCFNPFSHPVIAPDVESHASQNFKFFNSTQRAFDELLKALQDDGSSIIGLWGMGGSGKTTLVKEVGKKAKEYLKLFDRVVLTTISQSPDIRKIQGEIADLLGIELKEESETGRAKRIALRLQSGERILIILDDVWAKLNLEDIGIPFGENHERSCKIVMTTRRRDVCTLMDCQETIKLDLLEEDEALTLFQTDANVGDVEKDLAREIAMECKGLPIAIVAVGTCLKEKGTDEMKVMLFKLRNAKPINVDKGVRDAFACLKLSYDYLKSLDAKLLLMCAMFPEDHNIDIEDIFRYGVGLGLCTDVDSFETARSQVRATINNLIGSSLLMRSSKFYLDENKYVTMHDVVRDFALWEASEEDRTIMVNCTKELDELIVDEKVKDCHAVCSWYDNNKSLQFPSQLDAPKLEFLLLRSRNPLDMSHASFEGIKRLKALIILCMSHGRIELQPQSIQQLSNLQTLRLQGWDLRDISFVVSLTRLEILDLQGSRFARMPNGIEKLNKLKLLDLSGCEIDECCYEVIGRCSQLEELYVSRHVPHSTNAKCFEYLVGPAALMKLRRYNLEIGDRSRGSKFLNEGTRSLSLGHLNISKLGAIIKDLVQRATAIEFYELEGGSKSFMANIVQAVGGVNELTKLRLVRCSEIECITDETTPHENAVVPLLDELMLNDMDNFRQLCLGPTPFTLFRNLRTLIISSCPQLLHIFPADCNLGNLKFLGVSNCPMLTSLFPVSAACTLLFLEELQIGSCDELKHVLEGEGGGGAWENLRFPKLKILYIYNCRKLEYICPVFLAQRFVQLHSLSISDAPQMKFVFGENVGEGQPIHDQYETQLVLPLLEYLKLANLPNLIGICSERYHPRWPSLKTIDSTDCPNMRHQMRNEEYENLAAIEMIYLDNCGEDSIFSHQIGVEERIPTFQYLKELTLVRCERLKFVFSAHFCQSLPELSSITIYCCEELEAIFSACEDGQKNVCIAESCLLKLKRLEISECNKLKFILYFMISATTSMLPQLSTLSISDCSQMEEIFKCSNNIEYHDIDSEREMSFPNMENMVLQNLPRLVNFCQGSKLHIGEFCKVKVHGCPQIMPIRSATIDYNKEGLVRKYVLKYNQLNNNDALNLPLSVLIAGELDIRSSRVEHEWGVIGDDEQEEQQMLGGVVPTQVLNFQYLHSLKLTQNKKLKFLFSMRTIIHNSLPRLTSLTLSDCEELEVVFGHSSEDDANYSETIVLSSLREIKLKKLPNFMSVCQGLQVQVDLRNITIRNCPKFVDSSLGPALKHLGTLSLPQVSTEDSNFQTLRAERLSLMDLVNLTSVWEGPNFVTFQNLKDLSVNKCRRLKCIFPGTVIRSIPCLKYLWIEECEELEEMMSSEEEHHFPNESSNSLCFPQLESVTVIRCGKLKWLFPSLLSTQPLPLLYFLRIEECSQLKGLFNSEVEIHEEGFHSHILPQLRYLKVEDCPISKTTLDALQSWERRNLQICSDNHHDDLG